MSDLLPVDLLSDAHAGSATALGELVDGYRSYLLSVANHELPVALRAKVSASDIVQETVLHACRDFPHFVGQTRNELAGWLRQILRNNLIDAHRAYQASLKRQVARESPLDRASSDHHGPPPLVSRESSPSTCASAHEQAGRLEQALARLSDPHRTVVLLRSRDGLSFPAIAQHLGRSPEASRKLWVTAIEHLQRALEHSA
jgi:RNA polymerase sigma-70 factor, ECF subfamily